MKICMLTTSFPRYKGDYAGIFVYHLAKAISSRGNDVLVIAPNDSRLLSYEKIDGIGVYRFNYFIKRFQRLAYGDGILPNIKNNKWLILQVPFFLFFQFMAILKIAKKERPDVIHAHWIFPTAFSAVLAKKLQKIPVISTVHGGDIFGLKGPLFTKIIKYTLKRSYVCTVNSKATLDAVRRILERDYEIIPMGVNTTGYSKERSSGDIRRRFRVKDKLLLFVGRITEKKGVEYLIRAIPDVLKAFPHTKLLIVGEGDLKEQLQKLSFQLHLQDAISFTGSMTHEELPNYFASADIFIGPSIIAESGDTEGLGVVFLEALAAGCAVVASNVGGISDVIIHEKTGLLVEQKNPDQIAEAIIRLIEDGDLRKRLIENSRQHVEDNFGWDKIGQKFHELILRVSRE